MILHTTPHYHRNIIINHENYDKQRIKIMITVCLCYCTSTPPDALCIWLIHFLLNCHVFPPNLVKDLSVHWLLQSAIDYFMEWLTSYFSTLLILWNAVCNLNGTFCADVRLKNHSLTHCNLCTYVTNAAHLVTAGTSDSVWLLTLCALQMSVYNNNKAAPVNCSR